MSQHKRQLKVVKLMDPEMCNDCRFAQTALVKVKGGLEVPMVKCTRLDCDNWIVESAEEVESITDTN